MLVIVFHSRIERVLYCLQPGRTETGREFKAHDALYLPYKFEVVGRRSFLFSCCGCHGIHEASKSTAGGESLKKKYGLVDVGEKNSWLNGLSNLSPSV